MNLKVFAFGLLTLLGNTSYSANPYVRHYFFNHFELSAKIAVRYLLNNVDTTPDAAYILGTIYLETGDLEQAQWTLEKAAEKNHKGAINALGDMYYSDKKDITTAMKYYKKAAEMGFGPSQFNLGIIYKKHLNNPRQAKYWLMKAYKNTADLSEEVRQAAFKHVSK